MKDWTTIAQASGLDLNPRDVDRIVPPLEALQETFRPLVADLSPDLEPCFHIQLEDEA